MGRAESVLGRGARQRQISWLTEELSSSSADWKFVFGHHPVYSAGSHGITTAMLEELDPIMRRYGVQALFSGHDHSQQLMQHRGMNYIISGAGGARARRRSDEYPLGSQKVLLESHGFAGMSICSGSIALLTFYSADGQVLSTASLTSRPPDSDPEAGTPALANGAPARGTSTQATCGGKVMPDVEVVCPVVEGSTSGCKVLADNMKHTTCREYCMRSNLGCRGGWEEASDDCNSIEDLGCDRMYASVRANATSGDDLTPETTSDCRDVLTDELSYIVLRGRDSFQRRRRLNRRRDDLQQAGSTHELLQVARLSKCTD